MTKSVVNSKDVSALRNYGGLIKDLSGLIRQSRFQAVKLVNREMLHLYFTAGKLLSERISRADWGDKILHGISSDIQKNFPGLRGFSISNLKNMRQFFDAYPYSQLGQSLTGQFDADLAAGKKTRPSTKRQLGQSLTGLINKSEYIPSEVLLGIGFTHHVLLMQKCRTMNERRFYMQQTSANKWTVPLLQHHIESGLFRRKGAIASNFETTLPPAIKDHALDSFRDEYLLNFIAISEEDHERVLESELVANIRTFLMSLGKEFCFVGNQYRLVVEEEEFFIDLLFYHRKLQALIAIDLKAGKFKPEFAGKMNFYLEALDQMVKLPHENPSIGILLCKEKKNTIVEFAFKRVDRPMGVATYALRKSLPPDLGKFLPAPAELKKAADRK
jgi:predicted nuclease of restriction endonuclease-like (RecB) superfamily